MRLYNTSSKSIEEFKPLNPPLVTFYSCGPTVYDFTHIGHMRSYVNTDILKRFLLHESFQIKHIMNITDVGHLTGDDDSGEDKLEKGARENDKSVWDIANFYTDFFLKSIKALNIVPPLKYTKATEHIEEMIELIKKIEEKGYAYQTDEALYFDTEKYEEYGKLSGQKLDEKIQQAREEVHLDKKKKNQQDFALWFKRIGRFKDHSMHWDSPWGDGFPGWHIECSAMSMKYLGDVIDIHSGGTDHITVHHENELAQSTAATGEDFVRFWFHNEFLIIDGKKMSKSLKNFYTIDDIKEKDIQPIALRYLYLQTHYRQQMNFTWESIKSAQISIDKLKEYVIQFKQRKTDTPVSEEKVESHEDFKKRFYEALSNDLQVPQALAVLWEMLKSDIPPQFKLELLLDFDKILGLGLDNVVPEQIPNHVMNLAKERLQARNSNDFKTSDRLRAEIKKLGYEVKDLKEGFKLKKIN
ncbi:MAG: cysteine--tRNA ligase [Patescibacteria group bacterium]